MTAFGRHRALSAAGDKDITAEIKSVNSRYLDCTVKLPRAYSFLEERIRAYLSKRGIVRGKIEVYVSFDVIEQQGMEITLDRGAAASYISALKALKDEFDLSGEITVMSVAANKDLFNTTKQDEDMERDWQDVERVLSVAVDSFIAMRESEGERLGQDISRKIENIKRGVDEIARLSAEDIGTYSDRLKERISKLLTDFDVEIAEQRILTEAAIFADRACVDEETVRLASHFEAFREIMESPEPAGRKLDFLLQEINRETNTIGSKVNNAAIARIVVDNKAELEKIREQIQNIE
jgi:uncharacterized protein (TIGR00255 family)